MTTPKASDIPGEEQLVDISTLHEDPANARTHNERNLQAITASLQHWGQVENLVVQKSTGKVIGGNGRLQAMRALGWEKASIKLIDVDATQATALGLALNRTSELAGWDKNALDSLITSLSEQDFLIEHIGFDDNDIKDLSRDLDALAAKDSASAAMNDVDEQNIDPAPTSLTCLGDIYKLGPHTVMCGDSRLIDHVDAVCDGQLVDAVVTDPPYGIDHKGTATKRRDAIQNDGKAGIEDLLQMTLTNAYTKCREGATWYVWGPTTPHMLKFVQILTELKVWKQTIVWVKNRHVLGGGDFHPKCEFAFFGWKGQCSEHTKTADRRQDNVWECKGPQNSVDHPTTKPIDLIEKCLHNSTLRGDLVYDGFLGSGTTLLACERLGRRCAGIEISPVYVDVIVRRWESMTGRKAILVRGREDIPPNQDEERNLARA